MTNLMFLQLCCTFFLFLDCHTLLFILSNLEIPTVNKKLIKKLSQVSHTCTTVSKASLYLNVIESIKKFFLFLKLKNTLILIPISYFYTNSSIQV